MDMGELRSYSERFYNGDMSVIPKVVETIIEASDQELEPMLHWLEGNFRVATEASKVPIGELFCLIPIYHDVLSLRIFEALEDKGYKDGAKEHMVLAAAKLASTQFLAALFWKHLTVAQQQNYDKDPTQDKLTALKAPHVAVGLHGHYGIGKGMVLSLQYIVDMHGHRDSFRSVAIDIDKDSWMKLGVPNNRPGFSLDGYESLYELEWLEE